MDKFLHFITKTFNPPGYMVGHKVNKIESLPPLVSVKRSVIWQRWLHNKALFRNSWQGFR